MTGAAAAANRTTLGDAGPEMTGMQMSLMEMTGESWTKACGISSGDRRVIPERVRFRAASP
jgi:hypothetical protein